MMAKEYIEREAVFRALYDHEFQTFLPLDEVNDVIDDIPATDVVEVKHGEWKKRGNEKKCSRCEFIYYSNNDEWSFCPNCGAKMDGERKEQG